MLPLTISISDFFKMNEIITEYDPKTHIKISNLKVLLQGELGTEFSDFKDKNSKFI